MQYRVVVGVPVFCLERCRLVLASRRLSVVDQQLVYCIRVWIDLTATSRHLELQLPQYQLGRRRTSRETWRQSSARRLPAIDNSGTPLNDQSILSLIHI